MKPINMVKVPGLHRHFGLWAYCRSPNPLRPEVVFDPQVDNVWGGNALMYHEFAHAYGRHILIGLAFFLLGGPLYIWWRRQAEVIADRFAFQSYPEEFYAFCRMHPHPKTWWGRWLYCDTPEERDERART